MSPSLDKEDSPNTTECKLSACACLPNVTDAVPYVLALKPIATPNNVLSPVSDTPLLLAPRVVLPTNVSVPIARELSPLTDA